MTNEPEPCIKISVFGDFVGGIYIYIYIFLKFTKIINELDLNLQQQRKIQQLWRPQRIQIQIPLR